MDPETVAAAIQDTAKLLEADGAVLQLVRADPRTARIELGVDLSNVSCLDCILPPDQLEQVLAAALRRRIPEEFELILDDPRRST